MKSALRDGTRIELLLPSGRTVAARFDADTQTPTDVWLANLLAGKDPVWWNGSSPVFDPQAWRPLS